MTSVRIDKWLWAARFFKTRALATRACELGRIECNGLKAKASRELRAGDSLRVRNEAGEMLLHVLLLSDVRGPAPVAQTLYCETDESRAARLKLAAERKEIFDAGAAPDSKPSRRDRDTLDRLRGRA